MADVLTEEQKQARAAAKEKAIADGKKGRALREAADAAVKPTEGKAGAPTEEVTRIPWHSPHAQPRNT